MEDFEIFKLSTAMSFVMNRAKLEAQASKNSEIYPEHIFLGILKLSEMTSEEIAPNSKYKKEIREEIDNIKIKLADFDIDPKSAKDELRRETKNKNLDKRPFIETAVEILEKIQKNKKDGEEIQTGEVFCEIEYLNDIYFTAGKNGNTGETERIYGIKALANLTESARSMRRELLDRVKGQDHAVHAFAEGIFNSEVFAKADAGRRRPKALFVFAGPPGVGKTFLAEQGAELLKIPFKRFDMSNFSDHQAHINIIGSNPSYTYAAAGSLTGFVKKNPSSVLLFDEIEKCHVNTINLFLQILDAGVLHDEYDDMDIFFNDTIIIFTTNAGARLYDTAPNAAGLSKQAILDSLEEPVFPPAILSRMASGYPVMFNYLQAADLEQIALEEIGRMGELLKKQYKIKLEQDKRLAVTLMFSQGGLTDARTLCAQVGLFFKGEIFKLCRLWEKKRFDDALSGIKSLRFHVEFDRAPEEVKALYENTGKYEVLFFGEEKFAEKMRADMPGYVIHSTGDTGEGLEIAAKRDIDFVLLDAANFDKSSGETMHIFDNIPIAASGIRTVRIFFRLLNERFKNLPVYLLESEEFKIDNELLTAFTQRGIRGKINKPDSDSKFAVFTEKLGEISAKLYMHGTTSKIAAEKKILSFETVPMLSLNDTEAIIRLRDLTLGRNVRGEDADVLDEAEKPHTRFSDVIGAKEAKDELLFFIDFLKNPKKLAALGLRLPKGVLLYGPPGTGKTLLARAFAGESNVAFIPAAASSFVTKYQGSGPKAVKALFDRARRYAPSVVFIDEIDAIGRKRTGDSVGYGEEMALNALLTQMDGFSVDPKRPVFVLATTNFDIKESGGGPGVIDEALTRRFDRTILVDLPNKEDRKSYLELTIKKYAGNTVTQIMLARISERSAGLSLSNLETALASAGRIALKKNTALNDEILEEAFETANHGEKKDWGKEYLERIARHEAGHAYLCYLSGRTPAYLTIVARDGMGGYMEYAGDENIPIRTKGELIGRIRAALGGRAAEIVYYGAENGLSTGAFSDLRAAADTARSMICSYGMDDKIGVAYVPAGDMQNNPLYEKIIMRESEIIREELEYAVKAVSEGKKKVDKLVSALLEKNKLSKEETDEIFKGVKRERLDRKA